MGIPCFSKIYLMPHLFEERPRVGGIFRRQWIYTYIYRYIDMVMTITMILIVVWQKPT